MLNAGNGFFLTDKGVSCDDIGMFPVSDLRTCQSAAARFRSLDSEVEFSDSISKNQNSRCWFASDKFVKYRPYSQSSQQVCLAGRYEMHSENKYRYQSVNWIVDQNKMT